MDIHFYLQDELDHVRLTTAALVLVAAGTAACGSRAESTSARTAATTPASTATTTVTTPAPAVFCQDPFRGEDVNGTGAVWQVPTDATQVVAVEYAGLNAKPCRTVTARVEAGRELTTLIRRLNALRAFPNRLTSCPSDDGRAVTLTFTAPGGATVVRVHGQGCRLATSPAGAARRSDDVLYADLVALVNAHRVT